MDRDAFVIVTRKRIARSSIFNDNHFLYLQSAPTMKSTVFNVYFIN